MRERTDLLVLGTVNAPFKRQIGSDELARCVLTGNPDPWLVHVAAYFSDVSPDLILAFAEEHDIGPSRLARSYALVCARTGIRNPSLETRLVPVAHTS